MDTAFNFLETYSTKADDEGGEMRDGGRHGGRDGGRGTMRGYSASLAEGAGGRSEGGGIPRARVPGGPPSGPGARYFVPLKN